MRCSVTPTSAHMTDVWGWLKYAQFEGTFMVNGVDTGFPTWSAQVGSQTMMIVVDNLNPSIPRFYIEQDHTMQVFVYDITLWLPGVVEPAFFLLPEVCETRAAPMRVGNATSTALYYSPLSSDSVADVSVSANSNAVACLITSAPGCDQAVSNCINGRHFLSLFCNCMDYYSRGYRCLIDKFCGHD